MFAAQVRTTQSFVQTTSTSRTITARSIAISPFERWEDDNYAPLELTGAWYTAGGEGELYIATNNFEADDVHIDLVGNRVIVLFSRLLRGAAPGNQEYYGEFNIPEGFQTNRATVYFADGVARIQFDKTFTAQVKAKARAWKNGFALLTGRTWQIDSLMNEVKW